MLKSRGGAPGVLAANNPVTPRRGMEIDVIHGDANAAAGPSNAGRTARAGLARLGRPRSRLPHYAIALLVVVVCTAVGLLVLSELDLANIAMLYLSGTLVAAMWLGRGPSVLAAVLGVMALAFFIVPPRLMFTFSDVQYLVTFCVMLAAGLLFADLTARLRDLAETARERERRTSLLYAMSKELSAARDRAEVASVAVRHVHDTFGCDAAVLAPGPADSPASFAIVASAGAPHWIDDRERTAARWSFDHDEPAGFGAQAMPESAGRYQPLSVSQDRIGVLAVRPRDAANLAPPSQRLLLDAFVNQVSLALERVTLIEREQAARIDAESERLRSALLSSVSHDLRTPLATIAGAATALQSGRALDEGVRSELTDSIVREAERLSDLIANLVFATRLEAGVELRREWSSVEEVVGAGLARHREALRARPFQVRIPEDLPLIRADNAMLPQVIHNLVDNALRYTPAGTPIEIDAWAAESSILVKVADQGPGLTDDERSKVFRRFYRGRAAASTGSRSGIGLGLTICEGIVKAHGGRAWVENNAPRGAAFLFSLPIDRPQPGLPPEPPETAT